MDWMQGERFAALAKYSKIYYCSTHEVNDFFRNLPVTDDRFILISHNSDGCIMSNPDRKDHADVNLAPQNMTHWFGTNVNVKDSRVTSIPIGVENDKWQVTQDKLRLMQQVISKKHPKMNLVYVNHSIKTNPQERREVYDLLDGKSWVTAVYGANHSGFKEYLAGLCQHPFVVCPAGHGIDTHRTWEALYVGCIPIERRNINNQFYTDLPICFVDSWDELSEDFLINELIRIRMRNWNMQKLKFAYWKDLILSKIV